MVRNYLITAFRFLQKNKTFSFINIFGLATGTLCCLYILLYVQDQYSYDKHHHNAGDIYRITTSLVISGEKHNNATASPPIAPAMKNDFAEVQQFTRVVPTLGVSKYLLRYQEKSFYETNAAFVDSTFFEVFTYHFTHGNPSTALMEPYSVVLLKTVSDKLFGEADPTGKVITVDNAYGKHDFRVTGVIDESLGKSHIQANMFITMQSGGIGQYVLTSTAWAGNNFTNSYVKLQHGASAAALENKLPAFLKKYAEQQLKQLGMQKQLHLQPVTAIHTSTAYNVEPGKTVSPTFLYILLLIAVLIQAIACINFMNLSTARASKRAKEVGVRKVIGAGRGDLIRQFLGESFLISLTGVLIALPLLVVALPYLNQVTNASVQLSFFADYRLWLLMAGLVATTGLVAGSYPAFYLSAFRAIKVIKGDFSNHISASGIRRSLVVFQFVLSIVLITGIIVIYSQLEYMKNKDLGFDKSQKLIFSFYTADTQSKMTAFMDDLRQLPEVKAISKADNYPSQFVGHDHGVYPEGGNMATAIDAQNMATDANFIQATGIKIISGRDFRLKDSGRVLINETLTRRLGLTPETAPGKRLYTDNPPDPVSYVEIAGVMKDFNYNSLHDEVKPFMLVYEANDNNLSNLIVSTAAKDYHAMLAKMDGLWRRNFSGLPFEYTFLDEAVQKQYDTETTLSRIINAFTGIAILISCLGLFGLAAFSAEQRKKEIGIRKVLGANVSGLVKLLSKDFLKLVVISFVLATPVAVWAMSHWLQAFAYRVPLGWWMFALAGVLAVCIALLTVGMQAIKTAMANPVNSLRSE